MKNLRVGWLSAALFSLGLLLTACGSDSGDKAAPATTEAPAATEAPSAAPVEDVTLRVLVHQNPPMVEFMESFNDQFEAANPGVTIDMSVVAASDLSLATQTRLSANDIDVFDIFGFSNAAQPYMSDVTPPN